jgi:Glycine rich protein
MIHGAAPSNRGRGEAISEGHRRNSSWARAFGPARRSVVQARDRAKARRLFAQGDRGGDGLIPRGLLAHPGRCEGAACEAVGRTPRTCSRQDGLGPSPTAPNVPTCSSVQLSGGAVYENLGLLRDWLLGCWTLLVGCGGNSGSRVIPAGNNAGNAALQSRTFKYTGSSQTFTVPRGVRRLDIVARGAAGGGSLEGLGGRVYAIIKVTAGEKLIVSVGGEGTSGTGGFNGGGNAPGKAHYTGFGGGGASDIRQDGARLNDRILVAGGGGGQGGIGTYNPGSGGKGGGSVGGSGDMGLTMEAARVPAGRKKQAERAARAELALPLTGAGVLVVRAALAAPVA